MSRLLMVGVLGVLLALLGVMTQLVNPNKVDPRTSEAGKAQEAQNHQQAQAQEKKMREQMMDKVKAMKTAKDMKKQEITKMSQQAGLPGPPKGGKPPVSPTSMDITYKWFKNHPDGAEGLAKLEQL